MEGGRGGCGGVGSAGSGRIDVAVGGEMVSWIVVGGSGGVG